MERVYYETMKRPEMTPEQGQRYIKLQVGVAKLMLELGSVESPAEYVDRVAAIFEMMIMGELKMATEKEVEDMRNQVRNQLKLK